jgi:hypothetical protein
MRSTAIAVVLLVGTPAHAESLWEAELRVGYGVSAAGNGEMTTMRPTPLTVAAIGSIAVREEPRLFAYGGLTAEMLDRNAIGAVAGVRLEPRGTPVRLAGGGAYLIAPYSLAGATGSVGACMRGKLSLCGDVQLTAYFAGSDLADRRTVTQVQGVIGLVFDAL